MSDQIISGLDGIDRCWWPGDHEDYIAYHDLEWGRPVTNEFRLFEKICPIDIYKYSYKTKRGDKNLPFRLVRV